MKVYGLVGEKGSGKQTFVNFFKEIASSLESRLDFLTPRNDRGGVLNIRQVRFSDILVQTLILWDIPLTRENQQKLAIIMNDSFGSMALANAAKFSFEGDVSDIIILDGIRRDGEYELLKNMKNSQLIYITANQDLRYKRLKERSEKVGETNFTFEQFLEEEKSKAESEIGKISKKADFKIENNGTLEEFKKKIKQLVLKV